MDPVTIRRMIVFGVCALGVAGLYLVPTVSGSSSPMSLPRTAVEPAPRASSSPQPRVPQAAATGAGRAVDVRSPEVAPTQAADPAESVPPRTRPTSRPAEKGRTAFDPADSSDSEPPAAVSTISPAKVTPDELSLSWPAATDNREVIGYRIWLNGYEVASTAETRATVRWFNDDGGQHVVQIKAVDSAGNQSTTWSTLLVTRPSPEPTSTPTPSDTPTPTPTPEPSESESLRPDDDPTAETTAGPTEPAPKPSASAQ